MIVKPCDLETTIFNKGNAFDSRNEVCFVGLGDKVWDISYSDEPYGHKLKEIQDEINKTDVLVFVNAKFDLHHLRNLGVSFSEVRIWDCALVDFMLEGQTTPYPSMNKMADKYGLPQKPDIKETYWNNGIDTKDIPRDEVVSYLQDHDLKTTLAIYEIQKTLVDKKPKEFQRLVSLCNQDILVLQEMEYNGFYFDELRCKQKATELEVQIKDLRMELNDYHNIEEFNTESGDHLSALLYGGTITISRKELVGTYKTGDRKGEDKYGWRDYDYTLPRLFNPLPKTELKKEGYWATGEDVLKQLKCRDKAGKRLLEVILSLAKLEKMVGTYYNGLPKLREEMNWKKNYLHGNLNQVTARTGRLSSTKPNLQNIAGDMKEIFRSRYE
jgi:DNA polymerase I-like protein with 3'-5' exonuclease and polymerase domains